MSLKSITNLLDHLLSDWLNQSINKSVNQEVLDECRIVFTQLRANYFPKYWFIS